MKNSKFCIGILIFAFCILNFIGCATYKFQHGNAPYDQGFVVSRDDCVIPEYTVGKDNSVPNLKLAKERFKRRRNTVGHYYKKMGVVESRVKQTFWDPPTLFLKFVGGIFRLPAIAILDYKYAHNPKYREKINQLEEEKDKREEARIKKLKDELNTYVQKDLVSEKEVVAKKKTGEIQLAKQVSSESATQVTAQEGITQKSAEQPKVITEESLKPQELQPPQAELTLKKEEQPITKTEETVKTVPIQKQKVPRQKTKPTKVTPKEKIKPKKVESVKLPGQPLAVIIAKPTKGLSPLKVHFYGSKSYASKGRIIAYTWDFGDGDTSTKANPVNTYYSGSFLPKYFTVTLTVQDDKGNTAQATTTIEALNK